MSYGNISGSGSLQANGNSGSNSVGGTQIPTGMDGAGGGGGGGVIVLNSVGAVANSLTCNTNGGTGGNQVIGVTMAMRPKGLVVEVEVAMLEFHQELLFEMQMVGITG